MGEGSCIYEVESFRVSEIVDPSLQISAQESRRKKKEFVDTLERQVEVASQELDEYKKRCQGLEKENRYASQGSQIKCII